MQIVTQPDEPISFFADDPAIEVLEDCIYAPCQGSDLRGRNFWENKHWGIYDKFGNLVKGAAFSFRPDYELAGQNDVCLHDISNLPYAPGDRYFYLGNMIHHYGHFISSSMARVWAIPQCDLNSVPILGHAEGGPGDWFSWPFVRLLLGAAGLQCEDFARFDTPVRLRRLIVAHPSIVERNLVHRVFATTMNGIGDRLTKTRGPQECRDIAYISKHKSSAHPNGISNEDEIVEQMELYGIPVLYPEQLSLSDQIEVFKSTRCLVGQCGSAFHTSIFARPRENQVLINVIDKPNSYSSNHHLYGSVNGIRTIFVYFEGEWHPRENANPGLRLANPKQAAKDMIELAKSC